jgi:outer membrane protein TolC
LNLDIPIETAGKRGYRLARAQHLTEAARLNIASVAWQVRGRLRRAFVDVYAARQTESLLRQQMGTLEQVSRFLEAQHSAGEVSPFEVTQARIALDRNRLALHDAERRRGEAQAQLASAIGIPASRLDEAVVSFAGLAEMPVDLPPEQARRDALLNRADILSALAAYAATESALQLEVAKQYPDVRFSPGYEYDQGENKWSLGLSITLPVLNQNQGAIAEAEGRRTQAAVQFNALQARVLGEIDLAAASYRALRSKAATANSLLANLEQQQRNLLSRLEAGEISRLEVSTFQLELSQAALARLETVAQTQQALGALEEAVQSPMEVIDGLWRRSPRAVAIQEKDKHE